ncbi:hypothetical protein BH09PLA1_BH09PLA1_30400 [soil metagenome]
MGVAASDGADTGKTYVYLRTIFELNRRYGFNKFVIIVPSVAIKEGVYKTLQITEEHFRALYANVPFEYFLYDSSKLGQVRNFATSPNIQIMVVTVRSILYLFHQQRRDFLLVTSIERASEFSMTSLVDRKKGCREAPPSSSPKPTSQLPPGHELRRVLSTIEHPRHSFWVVIIHFACWPHKPLELFLRRIDI